MDVTLFMMEFFSGNIILKIISFCFFALFLFLCLKPFVSNIFDPLVVLFIYPVSCCMVIISWLYINKYISVYAYSYMSFLFVFFIMGILVERKLTPIRQINYKRECFSFFKTFYVIHSILFLVVFLLYFYKVGLAVFKLGKMAARENNGVIIYLQEFFFPGEFIILAIKRKFYQRKNKKDLLLYLCLFIGTLLGGSKAGVINGIGKYLTCNIIIDFFYTKKIKKIRIFNKYTIILIFLAIVGMFLTLAMEFREKSIYQLLIELSLRLFEFGDIYYTGMPNGVYEKLIDFSLFKYFIIPLFGPFRRILPFSNNYVLGYKLSEIVYNDYSQSFGPNARLFFVLYISQKYITSAIISFTVGIILVKIRKCHFFKNTFLGLYFSLYLIFCSPLILTDFSLFGVPFLGCLTLLPIIYFLSYVLYRSSIGY